MKCQFVVGQKVVCIYPGPWDLEGDEPIKRPWPLMYEIYTVGAIEPCPFDPKQIGVKLLEFDKRDSFNCLCFAPLQDKKKETDISVFKKMLDKVPELA